ncbi:hypothetical protein KRX19_05445 [Cardiobacteriaceae bacterium TAE3-ERU3]|nr:hypothetical protein [Cardiobacteriaceae bacterium TAE3-ERU3]
MSNDNDLNPNDPEQREIFQQFLESQMREMEVKQAELENEKQLAVLQEETAREKIKSDTHIAETSIAAQLEYEKEKMKTVREMQSTEKGVWVLLIAASVIIICVALFTDNAKEAFQFLTYGVSAIAGYFAGVAKTKSGQTIKESEKTDE